MPTLDLIVMEIRETEDRSGIQSVKGAISFYGDRLIGPKPGFRKPQQMEPSEKNLPSRMKELHFVKRDIDQFSNHRKSAESVRTQAESELFNAKKKVKDLTRQIEEANLRTKARKQELEILNKSKRGEEKSTFDDKNSDCCQYSELLSELESTKRELSKLKLEMSKALETKAQANKETKVAIEKSKSCSGDIERLRKEIEDVNEEQILVELARIEALKEYEAIKSQRDKEATKFSSKMEKTQNRIKELSREIQYMKELETKLAITSSDVDVLQNELKLVKAMESRSGTSKESEILSELKSVTDELETAKKELGCIREGGFKIMVSMDIIREEFKEIADETARLKKTERKTDSIVQNLSSKLLKAKSKLEATTSAEKKANLIVSNLSTSLEHLRSESDSAKKEVETINGKMFRIKEEIEKNESEIKLCQARLPSKFEELEAAKASELESLEKLKNAAEKTMKTRATRSQNTSSIRISRFEYEYLKERAKRAEELAEKKVVAAQSWVEAIKASEKEIVLSIGKVQKEIEELSLLEDQEVSCIENNVIEEETEDEKQTEGAKNLQIDGELQNTYMKDIGNATPRRARYRRPSSPGGRYLSHSGSVVLRRRRKVMPNLVKLFKQ